MISRNMLILGWVLLILNVLFFIYNLAIASPMAILSLVAIVAMVVTLGRHYKWWD